MFVYFYISIIYNVNDEQENDMFQNNVTSMSQQGNFIEIWFEERLKIICFGIQHKNRLMGRPGDLWCRAHSMTARYLTLAVSCQIWHEKQKHSIVLVDNYVDASVLTLQNSNNCWRILRYNRNNAGKRHSGAFSFVLCGAAKLKRIRINIPFYHTRLHCCISMWVEDKLPNPEKVCAHTLPFICTSKPMPVSLILPSKYILIWSI